MSSNSILIKKLLSLRLENQKVIDNDTVWGIIYYFRLMFYSNYQADI